MTNNGMITTIWGPPGWLFLHSVTFGYPETINPNNEEHILYKEEMKKFFTSLGNILPCKLCRKSYNEYINESDTLLDDNALSSRLNLVRWFYKIHNKVNQKLNVDPNTIPSFQDFYNRYEMYRAKCVTKNKTKGCIQPKDKIKKHSHINIVDEFGNDYTVDTTINDDTILKNFCEYQDKTQLHLMTDETKTTLKNKAIYCIKHKVGNQTRAKCIIENL